MKACLWGCFGAAAVVGSLVGLILYFTKEDIWCDQRLNAGECEHSPFDKSCYCIDESTDDLKDQKTGIYEYSASQCAQLHGTLATPDTNDLLIWLSKRMLHMGVDEAYVGLQRLYSEWFWMKRSGSVPTTNLIWRENVSQDNQQNSAVISVETVKIENEETENGFVYYDYNHYLKQNPNYLWYGFKTASNIYDSTTLLNIYYICHYISQPPKSAIEHGANSAFETQTDKANDDACFCSNNEKIKLSTIESSHTFSSPGYPQNYCSDNNCRWTITTRDGLVIKLEWIAFSTENGFDMVYIHDGEMGDDPLVDKCTGSQCADQQSSSNQMHIHFSSDHVTSDIGFQGKVTAIGNNKCYCSKSLKIDISNVGDSFAFQTPNHPNPYCVNLLCSWTIAAPVGYGLRIVWNKFELGHQDFMFVHDGGSDEDGLLQNCTNSHCKAVVSSRESIHVVFHSDEQKSTHSGFAAVITSVQNYCKKEDLYVPLGSVTYSAQRKDGFIPIRGTATLKCSENSKINGTIDTIDGKAYCTDMGWSVTFCVAFCPLNISEQLPSEQTVQVCKVQDATDMNLVASAHSIHLTKYDRATNKPTSQHTYTCDEGSNWQPSTPLCHSSMGVILIGGGYYHSHIYLDKPPEIFSPSEHKTILTKIANFKNRMNHVSLMLEDGWILIAGGYKYEKEELVIQTSTEYIDLNTLTAQPGPEMLRGRLSAGATVFNRHAIVCGGHGVEDVFVDCETLQEGQWKQAMSLPSARADFALIATHKRLFTIGGKNPDSSIIDSVHKYCPEEFEGWKPVASMGQKRESFAAAAVESNIYVCGGFPFERSCEYYSIVENAWRPIAPVNAIRYHFTMAAVHGKLYAFGGSVLNQPQSIEMHDQAVDQWLMAGVGLKGKREASSNSIVPLIYRAE